MKLATKFAISDTIKWLNSDEQLADVRCQFCGNVKRIVAGTVDRRQEPVVVSGTGRRVASHEDVNFGRIFWYDAQQYR